MDELAQEKRHLLLCVAGLTPPIIMETLYALTRLEDQRVDEVIVVTTLLGQHQVTRELLDPAAGKFHEFCRDYPPPKPIKFDDSSIITLRTADGRPLKDIRTLEDNRLAAEQIYRLVRQLTRDPQTRIHASTAGGRKTMGYYLLAAMQVFGRSDDRASHTLVNEDFEYCKDFYYPPPAPRELEVRDRDGNLRKRVNTADAVIDLAYIPFIKLRRRLSGWLRDEPSDYETLVASGQQEIDFLDRARDVRLNAKTKCVLVGGREVKLTEREFYVYTLFAYLSNQRRNADGFVPLEEIMRADFDAVCRMISRARGRELNFEQYAAQGRCDYLEKLDLVSVIEHLARKDSKRSPSTTPKDWRAVALKEIKEVFEQIFSKINHELEEKEVLEEHLITSRGQRGALRYGLSVAPERIILP